MTKFTAFTIGSVLAAAVATLIIAQHRSEIRRLRADIQSLREQRDHLSNLAAENVRLSDMIARIGRPEVSPNEPPRELLRLRGEVARLRQGNKEAQKLRQENNEEIEKLRQLSPELPGHSLRERYGASGIDTNSVPNIELGATTNDVLAELRRVGAKFLTEQEKYIGQDKYVQAEIFPAVVANTNGDFVTIRMEFYFEDGKLTSRKDWPKWPSDRNQQ